MHSSPTHACVRARTHTHTHARVRTPTHEHSHALVPSTPEAPQLAFAKSLTALGPLSFPLLVALLATPRTPSSHLCLSPLETQPQPVRSVLARPPRKRCAHHEEEGGALQITSEPSPCRMLSFALKKNEYQNYNGGKRKIQSKLWKITWRRYLKKKKAKGQRKRKLIRGKK